jgi:hypothetical protein
MEFIIKHMLGIALPVTSARQAAIGRSALWPSRDAVCSVTTVRQPWTSGDEISLAKYNWKKTIQTMGQDETNNHDGADYYFYWDYENDSDTVATVPCSDEDECSVLSSTSSGQAATSDSLGVTFAEPLVTSVWYRPVTSLEEKRRLYYSESDYRLFRRDFLLHGMSSGIHRPNHASTATTVEQQQEQTLPDSACHAQSAEQWKENQPQKRKSVVSFPPDMVVTAVHEYPSYSQQHAADLYYTEADLKRYAIMSRTGECSV